jgi:hypothetical protein
MLSEWIQDEIITCEVCGRETDMWKWFGTKDNEYFCVCYWCGTQEPHSMSYKEMSPEEQQDYAEHIKQFIKENET